MNPASQLTHTVRTMNRWCSRRSPVFGTKGIVSSDQAQASYAGLKVLEEGGTAADAAVTIGSVLSVTQPSSCGLGGDAWMLYYEAASKRVYCINGAGKTPAALTRANLERLGFADSVPLHHAVCTDVPGAPGGFCKLHERFGGKSSAMSLSRLFQPAIDLARNGFVLTETAAYLWECGKQSVEGRVPYRDNSPEFSFKLDRRFLTEDGKSPKAGQRFRLPEMADTYERLAAGGAAAFYQDGPIARSIVDCQRRYGGLLTLEDLAANEAEVVEPAVVTYQSRRLDRTFKVYEPPPTTMGVVTLEALNILNRTAPNLAAMSASDYYHAVIESLRYSFADLARLWRRTDNGRLPDHRFLLERPIADQWATRFRPEFALNLTSDDSPPKGGPGDTTYFSVVDSRGNACSVVYSTYAYFGTGYVPEGCGFTLNNRSYQVWEYGQRRFAPSVRPVSTLIAGMLTDESDELAAVFGCMGGQNQPQGHLQILLNLLEFGCDPQEALDRSRLMIDFDFTTFNTGVHYEPGISSAVVDELKARGHAMSDPGPVTESKRNLFGRGSVITKGAWWDVEKKQHDDSNVYWAACDPRSDGLALALQR